jgi:hypothetical protein
MYIVQVKRISMVAEICVRFAVLTVASKMQVLWDVKVC